MSKEGKLKYLPKIVRKPSQICQRWAKSKIVGTHKGKGRKYRAKRLTLRRGRIQVKTGPLTR